jgi:hypothetical protein
MLDMERMTVRPIFPEAPDSAASFQVLTVAANDAWQAVSGPDQAASTAAEFERMTGETRLAPLMEAPESTIAWADALSLVELPNSNFRPTVGATYLKRNVQRLVEATLSQKVASVREIIWLRPSGSTWGRTVRVAEALQEVREALRSAGHSDVTTSLLMPRSTHKTARSSHKRVFEQGWLLPQGHLPSDIEVLLVPGLAALVNVHVPAGRHAVAIGGLVSDPKRVARIVERLRTGQTDGWEQIWKPAARGEAIQTPPGLEK